jgi:hypothetical protein
MEKSLIKELQTIPGVGKAVASDLYQMGYTSIQSLRGQDPELMYIMHNDLKGQVQDICMLYTFRCAVYFAETNEEERDPQKLKWWNWMDAQKVNSIMKDKEIRNKKLVNL